MPGVFAGSDARAQYAIVACGFGFLRHLPRRQPDERVVPVARAHKLRHHLSGPIRAANVCQFMQQRRASRSCVQSCASGGRSRTGRRQPHVVGTPGPSAGPTKSRSPACMFANRRKRIADRGARYGPASTMKPPDGDETQHGRHYGQDRTDRPKPEGVNLPRQGSGNRSAWLLRLADRKWASD